MRQVRVQSVSIRSSLVNLPISIYGPLLERNIRPQNLAIHISLHNDKHTQAYLGWSGLASASSLAQFNNGLETIEIDPQYALALGFSQQDIVDIGLLHNLPFANSVATEPLSSDDWDIIEIHASHIESTLLSQVRVAVVGQEINVWVLGRTRVRLRVVSVDPQSKAGPVLLTTNTEVSIAPKPHSSPAPPLPKKEIENQSQIPFPQLLRVLPSRLVHNLIPTTTSQTALAYLSPQTFAHLAQQYNIVGGSNPRSFQKCSLLRFSPPLDPTSPPLTDQTEASEVQVYVAPDTHIPPRHIVPFFASDTGINDWDIVRITPLADTIVLPEAAEESPDHSRAPPPELAGVDDILNRCKAFVVNRLALHASLTTVRGVPALLLTGRSGTGKTSIAKAVAKILHDDPLTYTYTHYIDLARYTEKPVSVLKRLFQYWFDTAAWYRPSVLVFDNMDSLFGVELEHSESFRTRQLTELFVACYSSSASSSLSNARGIVLLGTASSQTALHPVFATLHVFSDTVKLVPPNRDSRKQILTRIIERRIEAASESITLDQDPENWINYAVLATVTEGYSAMDLKDLVARAVHQAAMRSSALAIRNDPTEITKGIILRLSDFEAAQVDFVPLSLRDIPLQKSNVAWSDIGGLYETKRILRETLEWPTKYGPIFAQSPLRLRSGLLLYGFPGCGKTLLASAIAKECGLNFISVKGPEILNKYIGASEKAVRDLFERATTAKPCVLFFDEFDAIAPKRGHDSTGVTDRVVNQLLTQMDGAEGLEGVYVLAATSRPDLIDSALLRPGRLDKSLFCDMPDLADRKDILKAVARKVVISPSVDLDEIAKMADGFSGADLQALVYNAHLEVIHDSIAANSTAGSKKSLASREDVPVKFEIVGGPPDQALVSKAENAALQRRLQRIRICASRKASAAAIDSSTSLIQSKKHEITPEHIRRVIKTMGPSVSPGERERLGRIYRGFVFDRTGKFSVPPEAGGVGNRVSLM